MSRMSKRGISGQPGCVLSFRLEKTRLEIDPSTDRDFDDLTAASRVAAALY